MASMAGAFSCGQRVVVIRSRPAQKLNYKPIGTLVNKLSATTSDGSNASSSSAAAATSSSHSRSPGQDPENCPDASLSDSRMRGSMKRALSEDNVIEPPAQPPADVFELAWAAAAAAGDVSAGKHTTASVASSTAATPEAAAAATQSASVAGDGSFILLQAVSLQQQQQQQQQQLEGQQLEQQQLEQQELEQLQPLLLQSEEEQLDLQAVARRYQLVSLALLSLGVVLTLQPGPFIAAAFCNAVQPSGLEATFARLMGVALLFRGLVALSLKAASENGRLDSTTAQRVMLGCLLPCISHYLAFKSVVAQWVAELNVSLLLYLYPTVLAAEFYTHMMAFQVYNPYIGIKMLWPVAAALLIQAIAPPLPPLSVAVPRALTPVTAGAAVLLSRRGIAFFAKAATNYMRKKLVSKAFGKMFKAAGPALTGTVVHKMDFLLPSTSLAWGYWFMMLNHFATMFDAYMPEHLFLGQVTRLSALLKQSWSAGFLAAAFACDALKTAADRQHLVLQENRHLNLCLALLEAGFATCLVIGMANGTVLLRPISYFQLATAVMSMVFCLTVWWFTQREAAAKGFPLTPTVSSYDWDQETRQREDYKKVTAAAVVVLNVITSCM